VPLSVFPANGRVLSQQSRFNSPSNTETHASKDPTSLSTLHKIQIRKSFFESVIGATNVAEFIRVGDVTAVPGDQEITPVERGCSKD